MEYRNLDEHVRGHMLAEVEMDIAGNLYTSAYFNERGAELWPDMLREAARVGTDDSLARAIAASGGLKRRGVRNTKKGPVEYDIPFNANETVAESNFSRFYLRGVCLRALELGRNFIVGYRAKRVENPRAGSEEKIGQHFDVAAVLADLRGTMSGATTLGMPPGPNSGILAYIPD